MQSPESAAPPAESIERQLQRLLRSSQFANSERLRNFLTFVVARSRSGEADQLKEYTIGVEVYGRGIDFDPKADSIVRTEARRLRTRLQQYYDGPGAHDPVIVTVPTGAYAAEFRHNAQAEKDSREPAGPEDSKFNLPVAGSPNRLSVGSLSPGWIAVVVLTLVLIVLLPIRRWPATASLDPNATVLLAPFVNKTGEPAFDGAFESAIEFELARTGRLRALSRVRIADTLRLMKLPHDLSLSEEVAREVALRESGVAAIVKGHIARTATGYLLSVAVVDPVSGLALAAKHQDVTGIETGAAAAWRIASWLRQTVQGAAAAQVEPSLERASTTSLAALRSYTEGMRAIAEGRCEPAEALFAEAILHDPEFASAYIFRAWCLYNIGRSPSEVWTVATQASHRAETASERERLFIRGSLLSFRGAHDQALPLYEAVVRLAPDDYWALNNLTMLSMTGNSARDINYWSRLGDLRPADFRTNLRVATWLLLRYGAVDRARLYLQRARRVAQPEDAAYAIDLLDTYPAWHEGNVNQLAQRVALLDGSPPRHGNAFYGEYAGMAFLGTGRLASARAAFRSMTAPVARHRWAALAAIAAGDHQELRVQAAALAGTRPNPLSAILLSWAGFPEKSRHLRDDRALSYVPGATPEQLTALWDVAEGERLATLGHHREAVSFLQRGMAYLEGTWFAEYFIAARTLAALHHQAGHPHDARAVLRRAVAQRGPAFSQPLLFWVRCAAALAGYERALGRPAASAALEDELRVLLAGADSDYRPDWSSFPAAPRPPHR